VEERQPPPIETKKLIIGMVLAMAIVIGYQTFFLPFLYKKMGWQLPHEQAATQPSTAPAAAPATQFATTAPGVAPTTGPAAGALQIVAATQPAQTVALGSAAHRDKDFALELSLDPVGAGVRSVVLNDFKQSADKPDLYRFQEPYDGFGPQSRPLGTRWVTVNGQVFDLSIVAWRLVEDSDPTAATYVVEIAPSLQVRKTFRVFRRDAEDRKGSAGFETYIEYGFKNLTGADLKVKTAFNGATLPPPEVRSGPDRQVVGGHRSGNGVVTVHAHHVEAFSPEEPNKDLTKDDDGYPVIWAGGASVYFEGLVLPVDADGKPATYLQAVRAEGLDVAKETKGPNRKIATVFETAEVTVPANGQIALQVNAYFGPKWRKVLKDPYYVAFPRAFHQTLVIVSGYCAVCTFDWLINLLVWMLGIFHTVTRDWGLAIICLVVLVRSLLHPITKRSQISMMKMGKMGPQMEALKKKYGDDKEALSKAMWEFQKSQGMTPILGCLPMFLQMPIWIALWSALQTTFELRQAPFLWGFTWIDDLSKPDHVMAFRQPIELFFGWSIDGINLLPFLLAAVFWLQQKVTPKPPAMTPEQAQQQKMMQWMTLLFPLFLYNGPAGLNLYILTSTTIGIIESHIIRKHIREREELEKGERVIVDAKPTRGSKRKRDDDDGPLGKNRGAEPPKKPTGWIGRKIAELQEKAEQIRREAEKKAR
jgi:YidC/Oxa1 family membrane protein insertase